jgi:hypothetical protein
MISTAQILNWGEIGKCPEKPGIYAWYFRPELTDHDVLSLIQKVKESPINRNQEVEDFLFERLFKYFTLSSYQVEITGQLKPKYKGRIQHTQEIAKGLVDRIAENPERLFIIRDLLQSTSPMFASPLYIGMSKNLRARIKQHCSFIKELRERSLNPFSKIFENELSEEEKNFAQRIVERDIPSSRLFIAYETTKETDDKINVDVETIVNRIYFPAFGRN